MNLANIVVHFQISDEATERTMNEACDAIDEIERLIRDVVEKQVHKDSRLAGVIAIAESE